LHSGELLAWLKNMNNDKQYAATYVVVGSWTGVIFHETEMCQRDTLALRVRGKTVYLTSGPCDSEVDRDIMQIASSIR